MTDAGMGAMTPGGLCVNCAAAPGLFYPVVCPRCYGKGVRQVAEGSVDDSPSATLRTRTERCPICAGRGALLARAEDVAAS